MKVIITKRFEKKYLSKITKYFKKHHLAIELKSKEHKIIHLNKGFFKFKNNINLIDFRGIEVIIEGESIIPLLIFLKKDKNYGENIRWESYEKITEKEYDLAVKDIKNGDFEIF